ncbi:MAG: hypothetical protein CMO01_05455 [Thalassobius sp.]|nr:hypothetical protein [Thalassovita sp.]
MNHQLIKDILCEIGEAVCNKVIKSLKEQSIETLSAVHEEAAADTIYQIDKDVEDIIVPLLKQHSESLGGIVLLAEGIEEDSEGGFKLPDSAGNLTVKIIMDPIDGTRGIMYDKRSAFFLAGAAPNKPENYLSDIEVAVMVELPTTRSAYSDTLWAIKEQGANRFSRHLESNELKVLPLRPSKSPTLYGGFGQISRFFPPGREILAAIEEDMLSEVFPDAEEGKTIVFEDQYISTGGQMYELLVGHDRFVADVRTLLNKRLKAEGRKKGHICHPYDICVILIAEEVGIVITDGYGNKFDAAMNLYDEIDWIGYANSELKNQLEKPLFNALKKHKLLD